MTITPNSCLRVIHAPYGHVSAKQKVMITLLILYGSVVQMNIGDMNSASNLTVMRLDIASRAARYDR